MILNGKSIAEKLRKSKKFKKNDLPFSEEVDISQNFEEITADVDTPQKPTFSLYNYDKLPKFSQYILKKQENMLRERESEENMMKERKLRRIKTMYSIEKERKKSEIQERLKSDTISSKKKIKNIVNERDKKTKRLKRTFSMYSKISHGSHRNLGLKRKGSMRSLKRKDSKKSVLFK